MIKFKTKNMHELIANFSFLDFFVMEFQANKLVAYSCEKRFLLMNLLTFDENLSLIDNNLFDKKLFVETRNFVLFLKNLNDEEFDLSVENRTLILKSSVSEMTLSLLEPKEGLTLESFDLNQSEPHCKINGLILSRSIQSANKILQRSPVGIANICKLHFNENQVIIEATDINRMMKKVFIFQCEFYAEMKEFSLIFETEFIAPILNSFNTKQDQPINLSSIGNYFCLSQENQCLFFAKTLIQTPSFQSIVQKHNFSRKLVLERKHLNQILKNSLSIIKDQPYSKYLLSLVLDNKKEQLIFQSRSPKHKLTEKTAILHHNFDEEWKSVNPDLTFLINGQLFFETINNFEGEKININFFNNSTPMLLSDENEDSQVILALLSER